MAKCFLFIFIFIFILIFYYSFGEKSSFADSQLKNDKNLNNITYILRSYTLNLVKSSHTFLLACPTSKQLTGKSLIYLI